MESSPAILGSFSEAGVLPDPGSPFQSECLATALELLEVLKEEAGILRQFTGTELLRLVPRKEYLVRELEWKLQSTKEAGEGFLSAADSLKALFREIDELNTSNGVFIERTISYWEDFLSVLLPPGYGPGGEKTPCQGRSPRGLTFKREI
jgi:hypothetical protein